MAPNVFNRIPSGFFNLLSSGSDNINNAGCLLEIYSQSFAVEGLLKTLEE